VFTPSPTVARAVAVMIQLSLAAGHFILLPDGFRAVSYVGVGEIGLMLAALVGAALLMGTDIVGVWWYVALVALVHVAGYIETRLVGLPLYRREIGHWLEPRDMLSVFAGGVLLALAGWVLVTRAQAPQRVAPGERFATLHRP
jgi:hypothetical protein